MTYALSGRRASHGSPLAESGCRGNRRDPGHDRGRGLGCTDAWVPRMNPAEMLAESMGGQLALGWAVHLLIGVVLAVIYGFVAGRLPGPPPVRGALFALAPWLLAQGMGAMMPGGFTAAAVSGSLIGHLVYGAVVGAMYGPIPAATAGPSVR